MIKVSLTLLTQEVDALDDFLNEIAPSPWLIIHNQVQSNTILEGYFESTEDFKTFRNDAFGILKTILECERDLIIQVLEDCEWVNAYKDHFKPWSFKSFHWIPIWLENQYATPLNHNYLYLDPGMAFGTGNHETTRLCLEEVLNIESNLNSKSSLLDLGCGSGIISLTASKLGYEPVLGIDIDEDAIRISKENAVLNSIKSDVNFSVGQLNKLLTRAKFDVVIANIQTDLLIKHADKIVKCLSKKGILILSGILKTETKSVVNHYKENTAIKGDLEQITTRHLGEWSVVTICLQNEKEKTIDQPPK
jgi:ribosomal protein L11 methyltransferase|tara:strand:+ start:1549 stop:2466 length:918 start_codon:yes stop_codon:yes gene_type:complete